jgi:exopolysaccharide/PEP-CTERM locus tyrosine autokinase
MTDDIEKKSSSLEKRRESVEQLLVPSSMEVGPDGVDKYIISKRITKMDEPRLFNDDELLEKKIIFANSPHRQDLNTFRTLRTKLLELSKGQNFSIVVTSPQPEGGTSFIAANLAAAFALDTSKTAVIIDCHIRHPSLHEIFDLFPEYGLTDFLESPDLGIGSIIYPSGIKRLRVIPAGQQRESGAEFFTSFRMKQFLNAVKKRYPDRFIIIDAPSVIESPDSKILSELCNYTLLVVPKGKLTESTIQEAVSAFNPDKLAGVVFNG